ncbi:hypothetical protein [Phocaeicola barnesiae]|uniref:hypothetical protein n=1 Tax=Phocaeicola barnesiae TaxID=376804 RepID=UPI0025A36236|nr:hypothetical protein [Phocaeicola barnesiae]MDM8310364.1 hypothetical protein [Phocaeicola barnesiae]
MNVFIELSKICLVINYLYQLFFKEGLKCYIPKNQCNGNKLLVLVNGPSLNKSLSQILDNEQYKKDAIISVNFMVNDDRFYILKPKYHVISDPMFYISGAQKERVDKFFECLNTKIDWDMYLFLPIQYVRIEKKIHKITNAHVKVIPIHQEYPHASKSLMKYVAKKGILGPDFGSVMHHAVYIGMIMGFKTEELYGADHTFFDGLMVNEKNQVCRRTSHFYETTSIVKPLYHHFTPGSDIPYTMQFLLWENERIFKGHQDLRMIADYLNVHIINKTEGSMIDSYERF